VIFSTVLIPN